MPVRSTGAFSRSPADPAAEEILLQVAQPAPNHTGGLVAFGPDGYLYLGLGDGGGFQLGAGVDGGGGRQP
mgnify:CR=1 FL=1